MNLKLFLLASSAAIPVTSAAYGQDLLMPVEPIDYVGACGAAGDGFYTIPGTQTCLSIEGKLEFNIEIFDSKSVGNIAYLNGETNDNDPFFVTPDVAGLYIEDDYAADWSFTSEATVTFSTETPSDLGTIKTYFELEVVSDNSNNLDALEVTTFDSGYGAIGPILFGYTETIYEYSDAYTLDGGINGGTDVDQIQLSKTVGSWEVAFAAEDPRDRYDGDPKNATGDYPDLALALIRDFTNADIQASFGVTDRTSGTGWAAQIGGTVELANDMINLRGIFAYSDNAPEYVGGTNCSGKCPNEGGWWSTLLSGEIDITSTVQLQATASYLEAPTSYEWDGALSVAWSPTDASEVSVGVLYENDDGSDSVEFHTQLTTSFGD